MSPYTEETKHEIDWEYRGIAHIEGAEEYAWSGVSVNINRSAGSCSLSLPLNIQRRSIKYCDIRFWPNGNPETFRQAPSWCPQVVAFVVVVSVGHISSDTLD